MNSNRRKNGRYLLYALLALAATPLARAMNFYDQCVLVPYAIYSNHGQSTAVGLSARDDGTIFWQFRSAQAGLSATGALAATADRLTSFIWSGATMGIRFEGTVGSLLFCLDRNGDERIDRDDGDGLAGNALLIELGAGDVVFIPTANIDDSGLTTNEVSEFQTDLNLVRDFPDAAISNDFLDMQFLVDGLIDQGDETRIILWTSANLDGSRLAMSAFDAAGGRDDINVTLTGSNLYVINPESFPTINALPTPDGFLRWQIPQGSGGRTIRAFAFSVVSSPAFGAIQTVLGNY